MKKLTTVFLVLIIVLSMSAAAFALPDQYDEMILGAVNSTPEWVKNAGRKVEKNGIVNYISADGTTSAVMPSDGICWINCEEDGCSVWYGISNDDGTFNPGSRFWVKSISKMTDPEEYAHCTEHMDDESRRLYANGISILKIGVQDEDGKEYTRFDFPVMFYVQLGDVWTKDDLDSQYIASGKDERFSVLFTMLRFPDEGRYAVKSLTHFDDYALVKNSNSKTGSVIGDGNAWMMVSFAEILIFGVAILVLASKLSGKTADANSAKK